jgi:poly-gamma-glutamate synthesis protein (capsule biosynthesis protein)
MTRAVAIVLSFSFLAVQVLASPLFVEAPDELWPEWLHLLGAAPLPADVQVLKVSPGSQPAGDRAVLALGTDGKVVGFMPLVPVVSLGGEQGAVTQGDVASGKVELLPLCDVSLPELARPLDGLTPDQPGYPLFQKIALKLESSSTELQEWYAHIAEQVKHPSGSEAGVAWIEAVGDIMPARGVDSVLLADGGIDRVFTDALPVLRRADLLLGNLESTTASDGTPEKKSYTFRFRGEAVGKLKDAGFSYLSLANNHTFDFGIEGFLQTLTSVSESGIQTSGAGRNLDEASVPSDFEIANQEVRILSFGAFPVEKTGFDGRINQRAQDSRPGILWLDAQGFAAADRAFQGSSSFNIAFVHGGEEWRTTPIPEQQRLYRDLVRHGATLVLGAHPHVLQGMEAFNGSLIVYSLGNFLFPGMDGTSGGQDSIILRIGIFEDKVRYAEAVPVRLNAGSVSKADSDIALKELMARTRALMNTSP